MMGILAKHLDRIAPAYDCIQPDLSGDRADRYRGGWESRGKGITGIGVRVIADGLVAFGPSPPGSRKRAKQKTAGH
jgi:hypothetical protein